MQYLAVHERRTRNRHLTVYETTTRNKAEPEVMEKQLII
jgi:hypothetical protein